MSVPVTILCGFLGAGKTTLLNHLLTQSAGERWALIVNDVGAINVDARLVAQQAASVARSEDRGMVQRVVELGNGCVCCSIKDELAETLAELAMTGKAGGPPGAVFDHIVVETTGVAEPRGIANQFLQRNPFGRTLGDFARLQSLVTVIDAAHFLRLWRGHVASGSSVTRSLTAPGPKPFFELMLEQVEVADLLVLNKCDLVTIEELSELEAALRGLNARADCHRVGHGRISREVVLDRARFDARQTLAGAQWLKLLNALAPVQSVASPRVSTVGSSVQKSGAPRQISPGRPENSARNFEQRYGLRSFVYQERRPFRREKLEALLMSGMPGLVRAKGFCWWLEQPDEMGFLSVAGDTVRLDTLNYWWAALVESGKASLSDRPEMIRKLWIEPGGDRRQELVFIGVGLDETRLREALNSCLAAST